MNKRQRIAIQRGMCREAIAKLRAAAEFFADELVAAEQTDTFDEFMEHVDALDRWIFEESPMKYNTD